MYIHRPIPVLSCELRFQGMVSNGNERSAGVALVSKCYAQLLMSKLGLNRYFIKQVKYKQ